MDSSKEQNKSNRIPFTSYFDEVEDPRDPIRTLYPLQEVLFLAISSVLSGYESNRNIEEFGQLKLDWLRQFFPYAHGIPTHETIGTVIGLIDKKVFENCFNQWVQDRYGLPSGMIHIDGKRIRSSVDKMLQDKKPSEGGRSAELLVNAYASDTKVVLAQANVSDSGDEKQGAERLIEQLHLKGTTLTGDGNFCTKELLKRIRAKGGDYLMALKKNQPTLYTICNQYFEEYPLNQTHHQTQDNAHGRYEYRYYQALSTALFDVKKFTEYSGLQQLIKVTRTRIERRKEKATTQTHYYITSSKKPIEALAKIVRGHWNIENQLHWVLDVVFKEDESRKRTGNQASNFSVIRKAVLNMVNQYKGKKSIKAWRMACAISDKNREITLGFL